MKKFVLLTILLSLFLSYPLEAQKKKKDKPQDKWMDLPSYNWKYRKWGNYYNPRFGIEWKLGRLSKKISAFWKITNTYKEGTVGLLRMTHHAWVLDMDAYPQNGKVTGEGGAVIYEPGQTPKKTIQIYLPKLQTTVKDFKEMGGIKKRPLFDSHKKLKAKVQKFTGKPIRQLGGGKTETSKDTYIYEFWVLEKASAGYQYVIRVSYPEIYMDRRTPKKSIKRFQKERKLVLSQFNIGKVGKEYKQK